MQQMEFFHEFFRVFAPEDEAVDAFWVKRYSADLPRVHGVAHQNESFGNSVEKPVGIVCRNIGSSARADNHTHDFTPVCCFTHSVKKTNFLVPVFIRVDAVLDKGQKRSGINGKQ